MSRSLRALTEPSSLAAVAHGAGKRIRLVHRGRLEHTRLGVPGPSKRIVLGVAVAVVPFAWAPSALATPSHHSQTQVHSSHHSRHTARAHRSTAPGAGSVSPARAHELVVALRRARGAVLAPGTGYD